MLFHPCRCANTCRTNVNLAMPETTARILPPAEEEDGMTLTAMGGQYLPMSNPFEGQMRPSDLGIKAWTFDTALFDAPFFSEGNVVFTKIFLHQCMRVNRIMIAAQWSGTPTPDGSVVGLYSASGQLIVSSGDIIPYLSAPPVEDGMSRAFVSIPIPETVLEPGAYFLGYVMHESAGSLAFFGKTLGDVVIPGATLDARAFATQSGYTALPAEIPVADLTAASAYTWFGLGC